MKYKKKRLLPNSFYVRWEIELLSAFVLIVLLAKVPGWTHFTAHSLLQEDQTELITYGIALFTSVTIAGLCLYICLRLLWLYLVTFRQPKNHERLTFTRQIDQIAEILISLFIVLLVIAFFTYMLALLLGFVQNEIIESIVRPSQMNY